MTQVQEWGPHIWKILHYHAEYAGNSVLLADEIRAWTSLLRNTEGVLACAVCREHYRAWRAAHAVEEFIGAGKYSFQELLRRWLWDLHEYVNDRKMSLQSNASLLRSSSHIKIFHDKRFFKVYLH